nr:M55 family metallopeptidase [uncultured Butyrivibrio sp.]
MKQLIVIADMEGASGIFESNREALWHEELYPQYNLWRSYGRNCITSDVLAVCNAAIDSGIEDIMLLDMHHAGCTETNIDMSKLPSGLRLFDLPKRCMYWGRIRGQAEYEPYGIVTVGQHARNGEKNAYFPHTVHTPPIESFYINGKHVAEIGQSVMCFCGTPYIANVGCAASHKEARELSENVTCISVKDKSKNWEPTPEETFPVIYEEMMSAFKDYDNKTAVPVSDKYVCELNLTEDRYFDAPFDFPWKGSFEKRKATWEAHDIETALGLFWEVHNYMKKVEEFNAK